MIPTISVSAHLKVTMHLLILDTVNWLTKLSNRTGYVFRMPNDRLPKKLLFGEVKGVRPPGRPRSSFNEVTLRDCQNCRVNKPYRDAQDKLLWRDKTCPART